MEAGTIIFLSGKWDSMVRQSQVVMINGLIHQEGIIILKVYVQTFKMHRVKTDRTERNR